MIENKQENVSKIIINYPIFIKNNQQSVIFYTEIFRKKNFLSFKLPILFNLFIKNAKKHNTNITNSYIFEFKDIDEAKLFINNSICFVKPKEKRKYI